MKKINKILFKVVLISMLLFLCLSNHKAQAFSIFGIEIEWHWPWEDGFLWGDDDKEDEESSESEAISTAINNEKGGSDY